MTRRLRWNPRLLRTALLIAAPALLLTVLSAAGVQAQDTTGSVTGVVNDQQGAPLANVQVFVEGTTLGTITNASGSYTIVRVPAGTRTVRARLIGYRMQAVSVTIAAGQRATQNFTLQRDPLQLDRAVFDLLLVRGDLGEQPRPVLLLRGVVADPGRRRRGDRLGAADEGEPRGRRQDHRTQRRHLASPD